MTLKIEGKGFSLDDLKLFYEGKLKVEAGSHVCKKLSKVREFVDAKLKSDTPFYGINTGFGILANTRVAPNDLEKLQENLIFSHAVGVGDPLPVPIVKLVMLLRANVLAMGYSGVRPETFQLLVEMINHGIVPVMPEKGSVGASGDLAPLSHLALAMLGRGDVFCGGKRVSAMEALIGAGLKPISLAAKEGIALINGTQGMAALGITALLRLENLLKVADITGALSLEGDRASQNPFDERIQKLRPHPGQIATAANVRKLIKESGIISSHAKCSRVQDPYSFRCIPQVHGAAKDAVSFARDVILREIASCTDNPIIFADEGAIISGGNFHGEPLAFAMDLVAIASAEIGSISERRVAILTSPLSGELKTKFLVPNPGLNSGLMIAHVTMSALVAENRILCHPASVDSVPTSGGQEDHVSMGMTAGLKALSVIDNLEKILAIELLASCQAIDLQLTHGRPGKGTLAVHDLVRRTVPYIDADREYRHDIAKCIELVKSGAVVQTAEEACGELLI